MVVSISQLAPANPAGQPLQEYPPFPLSVQVPPLHRLALSSQALLIGVPQSAPWKPAAHAQVNEPSAWEVQLAPFLQLEALSHGSVTLQSEPRKPAAQVKTRSNNQNLKIPDFF